MAGYWPHSFFASLWTSTSSRSINTQKKNLANIQPSWPYTWSITHTYYMASSASGQDEPNRALWLATRAGKMEPSCPLGTTRCIPQAKFPQKPYNKSFIDQVCSVEMAGYWPRSFFASLWTSTSSRSINTQKKNLANIQPSWPHTWSITHTYYILKQWIVLNVCAEWLVTLRTSCAIITSEQLGKNGVPVCIRDKWRNHPN